MIVQLKNAEYSFEFMDGIYKIHSSFFTANLPAKSVLNGISQVNDAIRKIIGSSNVKKSVAVSYTKSKEGIHTGYIVFKAAHRRFFLQVMCQAGSNSIAFEYIDSIKIYQYLDDFINFLIPFREYGNWNIYNSKVIPPPIYLDVFLEDQRQFIQTNDDSSLSLGFEKTKKVTYRNYNNKVEIVELMLSDFILNQVSTLEKELLNLRIEADLP